MQDLKEVSDRLNQTPDNGSRPPSSRAPYIKKRSLSPTRPKVKKKRGWLAKTALRRVGKTPRRRKSRASNPAPKALAGHRSLPPPVGRCTGRRVCTACGDVLPGDAPAQAYAAWDGIDIEVPPEGGLRLNCTRHTLLDVTGGCCRHVTRTLHYRAGADLLWDKVGLSEWRPVGPNLDRAWLNRLRC
jgi:transposase